MDTESLLDNSEYLTFPEIPDWYKDNKYILSKYRNTDKNYLYYLYSIFKLHNETFNIWTHLIGAVLFLSVGIYSNFHFNLKEYWSQYICINLYIFSIFTTFLFSSIMHTFYQK